MIETAGLRLTRAGVDAVVLPAEGGMLSELRVGGRSILAITPWARDVSAASIPADSESEWVQRWRGGWQLCFPSAGNVDPTSQWQQGFHGVASQAPWRVVLAGDREVCLEWHDEHSLVATRTWRLTETGAHVETVVHNASRMPRPLVIAEHLILGGDLLAPVLGGEAQLSITPPPGVLIAPLDYAGHPDGTATPWPGQAVDRWASIDRDTPARVAALIDVDPRVIRVHGDHAAVTVSWFGLPHALVWEELARSAEPPWNSAVVALGLEPTSAAHGMGTAIPTGTIQLEPGKSLSWGVTLAVEWLDQVGSTEFDSTEEKS